MKPEQMTAWALHELSPEEQSLVEAGLRESAETQQQAAQTKEFCDFLSQELRDETMALDDVQRQRLIGAFESSHDNIVVPGAEQLQRPARPWWRRNAVISVAAAAAVALMSFLGLMRMEERQLAESASAPSPQSTAKDTRAAGAPAPAETATQPLQLKNEGMLVADAEARTLQRAPELKPAGSLADRNDLVPNSAHAEEDKSTIGGTQPAAPPAQGPSAGAERQLAEKPAIAGKVLEQLAAAPGKKTDPANMDELVLLHQSAPPKPGNEWAKSGSGTLTLEGKNTFTGQTTPAIAAAGSMRGTVRFDTSSTSTPPPPELRASGGAFQPAPAAETPAAVGLAIAATPSAVPAAPAATATGDFGLIPPSDHYREESRPPPMSLPPSYPRPNWQPRPQPRDNTESYTRIVENTLTDVVREPLSTFSIDVDTAAYANVRRFLNQNSAPPPDAVRIEELINYFPTNEEGPAPNAAEPFAVRVEMAACPWQPQNRLARIAIKGRPLGIDRKASNLVFLVDVSGSMNEPNKLPLVKQSLRLLTEQLGEGDSVAMVTYAGGTSVVLPSTHGTNRAEIVAAIDRLQPGGSTHGSAGIQLAYQQAVSGFIKGGVNRVILCTDGDFNVGVSSPEELEKLITEKARSGVFLSVLGYGTGNLKDRTMETLADKGNGNYAYIDSLGEARKVLVEQLGSTLVTIAKDVKIQVEFNPAVIRSYRLIGYENRVMAKEDFNDDRKDAGEIGAGHSVTALYEMVPANLPPGAEPRSMVDGLKYQTQPPAPPPSVLTEPARSGEAMTLKLRYKEPEGSTSKLIEVPVKDDAGSLAAASPEFKFTAAVAGFGLLLRDSSYAGNLTWEQVRSLALEGKGTDALGYRGEFVQLIERARGVK